MLDIDSREVYISKDRDPFMQMFLKNYCLRPSCYECAEKGVKMSDITIADFWGIERVAPDMNDGRGVSLVLVRSREGMRMLEAISSRLVCRDVSYEDGVRGNPSEYKSVERPKERDVFFNDMDELEFGVLQTKYVLSVPFVQRAKKKIKGSFPVLCDCYYFFKGFLKNDQNFRG